MNAHRFTLLILFLFIGSAILSLVRFLPFVNISNHSSSPEITSNNILTSGKKDEINSVSSNTQIKNTIDSVAYYKSKFDSINKISQSRNLEDKPVISKKRVEKPIILGEEEGDIIIDSDDEFEHKSAKNSDKKTFSQENMRDTEWVFSSMSGDSPNSDMYIYHFFSDSFSKKSLKLGNTRLESGTFRINFENKYFYIEPNSFEIESVSENMIKLKKYHTTYYLHRQY